MLNRLNDQIEQKIKIKDYIKPKNKINDQINFFKR